MEGNIERECSALGGLFQQIITDMKNGTPLWEDLVAKATKLHTCLRATIQAITSYLDAFQKIADAATNTRGATKEIGTALTRICLRHKAVEARMKTFTSAIMDCLVIPLQEKLEDWKKAVVNLDKEHAKEYKRARAELKKRSTDTLRLQKKVKKGKGGELERRVESCLQDVTEKRHLLEDTEKRAVRAALIEERSRFCLLVTFLKPVMDEEVGMLSELSHLQEVVEQVQKHTADPFALPPASEQVLADLKVSDGGWQFHTPPSSPSSLGSRKSSMCSISSLNSSSSGSTKSRQHSPSHHHWHRSLSQRPQGNSFTRLSSISSQDSGFTSQDALFLQPRGVQSELQPEQLQTSNSSEPGGNSTVLPGNGNSAGTLPTTTATWPNLQETLQFERAASAIMNERPHTISSAYEHGHQRPPLTVYTFQAPEACHSQPASPISATASNNSNSARTAVSKQQQQQLAVYERPPIPERYSSLERPSVPHKTPINPNTAVATPLRQVLKAQQQQPQQPHHHYSHHTHHHPGQFGKGERPQPPMYVNMHELATLAASKAQEMTFPPPPPELTGTAADTHEKCSVVVQLEGQERDGSTSESSAESSSGYGSQTMIPADDSTHAEDVVLSVCSLDAASKYCTLPRSGTPALPPAGPPRRRPLSATGYPCGTIRNALLRRGSMQGQKPPPPIRRTSSITSSAVVSLRQQQASPTSGLENLPPPPAFLLESTAAGVPTSSVSVADKVRTLTELKHTPASPGALRRNSGVRSASAERRGCHEASPGLMAALSAKLAPSLSPRNCRRHSEDLNPSSRIVAPAQGFLHALNTKLALQQQQNNRAARVRHWIASRTQPDPVVCHESLMDQIKRGTTLRRTGTVNDRSAPKIR